jgi:uncharacterized cupin superfamily protein
LTVTDTSGSTAGETVTLRHINADAVTLPAPVPKPTSRTGQVESTLGVWHAEPPTSSGVWECGPGEFTADRSECTEVCQILSGTATVTGVDGASADLRPGSLLVLPQGWRGTWQIHETVRKSFVMIGSITGG